MFIAIPCEDKRIDAPMARTRDLIGTRRQHIKKNEMVLELELGLMQIQMTQKPMLRAEFYVRAICLCAQVEIVNMA